MAATGKYYKGTGLGEHDEAGIPIYYPDGKHFLTTPSVYEFGNHNDKQNWKKYHDVADQVVTALNLRDEIVEDLKEIQNKIISGIANPDYVFVGPFLQHLNQLVDQLRRKVGE